MSPPVRCGLLEGIADGVLSCCGALYACWKTGLYGAMVDAPCACMMPSVEETAAFAMSADTAETSGIPFSMPSAKPSS